MNYLDFVRIPSRMLATIVSQYQRAFSEERLLDFVSGIRKAFDQYYSTLAEYEPGIDRAMVAHRLVNQSIQQSNVNPTCSRGCGACCHFEVEVTTDEAKLLTELVNTGVEIDRKKIELQASRERNSPEWNKPLDESNRCVFLGPDQACRIYDFRPMACRKHMVSSTPESCANGTDTPILLPLAEIAISAALSQPGNVLTSLSKALSSILEKAEEKKADQRKDPGIPLEI